MTHLRFLWIMALVISSLQASAQDSPPDLATEVTPIAVNTPIPPATLKTMDGKEMNLSDLFKKGPTLMIIYRGGWCPYCTTHLAEVGTLEAPLLEAGMQILAVSPDRPENLAATQAKSKLGYTLLSDSDASFIQALGLAFKVDAATREKYKGYGIDLVKASGHDHFLLPVPAVLVIDTQGVLRYIYSNPDYKTRLPAAKILETMKSLEITKDPVSK